MSSISPVSTVDVLPRNCNNEDNVLNINSLSEPLMGDSSGAASCLETQDHYQKKSLETQDLSPGVAIETVQIPESRSNTDTIAYENLALPVAETENNNVGTIGVWDSVPSSRTGSVASSSTTSYNTAGISQNYHQNRYRPQYQRGNGFNTRGGYRGGRGLQNRNRFNTNHCRGRFNNWNPNPGFCTGAVNFNGPVLFSQPPPMHQNHNLPRMVNPQLQQHEYFNAPNTGFNVTQDSMPDQ